MSTKPLRVGDLTWPQLSKLIADGEQLCLLPVGALEQHGRHLATITDAAIADAICAEASVRTRVPVLPTLWLTSSQAHTTKWPGTFAVSPVLLIQTVVQLADWVLASGFTKLLIVNAHGGNAAPLRVAVDEIRSKGELQVGLISWFDLSPEIRQELTKDGEDVHANSAETALMMYLHSELVHTEAIADDPDRTTGRVFSYTVAETSRDGVTGSPSTATAEAGRRLFEDIVSTLCERVESARREARPSIDW